MDMHIHFELARVKPMEIDHALIDTLLVHGAALAAASSAAHALTLTVHAIIEREINSYKI